MGVRRVGPVGARLGGWLLGGVLAGWGAVRRDRPLHTHGQVRHAELRVLRRCGRRPAVGSRLVDRSGRYRVLVRSSRALSWPLVRDIPGLAIRVPRAPGGPVDLLLAGTGTSRLGRYVLRFRRGNGTLTTLLPMLGPTGAVWFRADPIGRRTWRLSSAVRRGPWLPWATVRLHRATGEPIRTDPIRRTPDGLVWPRWVRLLRDPAYRWSQRTGRG